MVNDDRQSAIRRFVLVSVVGPLLVSAIAVVIQLFALPHVSTQVAVHWGTDGPDQLGPSWIFQTLTGGLAIGFVVLISLPITVSFARSPSGQPPTNLRFVTASLWAVTVFFGTSLTAALYLQRGLEATDPITGMGVWAGVAVGLGILAAAAGLIAAPGRMPSGQPTLNANVEELNISVGERLERETSSCAMGDRYRLDILRRICSHDDAHFVVGVDDHCRCCLRHCDGTSTPACPCDGERTWTPGLLRDRDHFAVCGF